jgi:hypothetical protein
MPTTTPSAASWGCSGRAHRRPAGPWSPFVHSLLRELPEGIGPRPVALDGAWETVTWVEGEAGMRPLSDDVRSDEALASVGGLLRRFHDAAPGVCHNDVGPWNVVFDGRRAVALIDWDMAGPGAGLGDLALAAWHFAPLYDDAECLRIGWPSAPDRLGRVGLLCEAYGVRLDARVWAAVADRQRWYLGRVVAAQADPDRPGAASWAKVDADLVRRDMAWIAETRPAR